MKYFGQPNLHIIDYKRGKEVFCFNEKGEYETNDPKLIEWMKKNKNFIKCEETIEQNEENIETEVKTEEKVETVEYQCKKCDFTTDNKGDLMVHYRTDHPKK